MTNAPVQKPAAHHKGKRGKPIEMFTTPNTLRAKLMTDRPPVADPLEAASVALQNLSREAGTWMKDEFARIETCRRAYVDTPTDRDRSDALLASAIDIAGLAPLAGKPMVARFATSLTRLLSDAPDAAARQVELVSAHVDAIRAARRAPQQAGTTTAETLAAELEARVTACVAD